MIYKPITKIYIHKTYVFGFTGYQKQKMSVLLIFLYTTYIIRVWSQINDAITTLT